MNITKTFIEGLIVIEPSIFTDSRGSFFESWNSKKFKEIGINEDFDQDNQSVSLKGVIRGLHFQNPPFAQAKLVRVIKGSVLDVAVDLRKKSKTYGMYYSLVLSEKNNKSFFIPKGFAHGFQVLSEAAIVSYKVDNYYNPKADSGIIWNDKDLSIDWNPNIKPILSVKDLKLIPFKELKSPF